MTMTMTTAYPYFQPRSKCFSRAKIALCLCIVLCNGIRAFQLSMVASRLPGGPRQQSYDPSTITKFPLVPSSPPPSTSPSSSSTSSITSNWISQMACMALKRRLKTQSSVSCDLTAHSNALLMGRVGPVTVKGRGWGSTLGLTCQAIEATVETCQLDMPRVLANRKLVLTTQAEGRAMVALTAEDFGNFITHPLLRPPCPPRVDGIDQRDCTLKFLKEGVVVDPSQGNVFFYGMCAGSRWKFTLQRAQGAKRARIQASLAHGEAPRDGSDSLAAALSETSTRFFNEMVFELDGTFLSFEDMMLTAKGAEPSVLIKLSILVKKFPSPGLEF